MNRDEERVEAPTVPTLAEAASSVGARALGLVQTRVELASVELAEARIRLVQSLLLVAAAVGCAMLALMVLTVGIIAWSWDTNRFLAITLLTLVYAGAAALLWQRYTALGRDGPAVLSATLAALRADAAHLRGQVADTPP